MNSSLTELHTSITFSWLDYVVFAALLAMSGSIGIFFGCFGSKQNSSGEYLLAGKRLHILPVAMSIIASNISGLAVLGAPADIYRYGAHYVWSIIPVFASSLACVYVFMPVLLQLELITTYQYLQLRFGKSVKILASFMYIFQLVTYNPVVIFLPCLAFSQATGHNIYILAPATTIFCVFYTAIGGLKTVVWTDTLQSASILLGSVVVLTMGLYQSGGVGNVFQVARDGGRLDVFNFDLDPTVRDTFWTYAIGSSVMWMVDVSINQGTLQRLSAVPTFAKVKLVMVLFTIISVIFKLLTTITGIAVYARYADCDPLQSGKALHMDQVVPYYVMDVGGSILGLPGLFIAGVFAAALSTLSTNLLNLATTIYTDFLSGFVPKSTSEKQISYLLKLIVVVVGIFDCCLVFLVAKFGGILQFAISLLGITYGSLLGIFTLGMVFPRANEKGALSGGLAGLFFSGFMVFGNLYYKYNGLLPDHPKPTSMQGCNVTTPLLSDSNNYSSYQKDIPSAFFRVSFWYFTMYGCLVTLVVGLLVSFLTSKNDCNVRPELISPLFQFMLPAKQLQKNRSCQDDIPLKSVTCEIVE